MVSEISDSPWNGYMSISPNLAEIHRMSLSVEEVQVHTEFTPSR
jgi:hypothetical protein